MNALGIPTNLAAVSIPSVCNALHSHYLSLGIRKSDRCMDGDGVNRSYHQDPQLQQECQSEISYLFCCTMSSNLLKKAYFEPNRARKNLVVLTGAHATRVILSSKQDAKGDRKAEGVEYQVESETFIVKALQEVILSAGE